ncbi:hypothetical protein [Pacificitalea manganoxidans]|uniref:hypothetical protein n=1 Tax=Pacificitalea manganoxidans TaxID=1411902 RepID=UPI0018E07A10|nr:hypothetical protein [Pacificitalea manganoxidans]MDR6308635.1 hypothetical protein [Pacificitalea manganoxidans]
MRRTSLRDLLRRLLVVVALATAALPHAAQADTRDQIIAEMKAQGFTRITVQGTLLGRTRILAERPGGRREVVINPRTGVILRDYSTGAAGTTRSATGDKGTTTRSGTTTSSGGTTGISSVSGGTGGSAASGVGSDDDRDEDDDDRDDDSDEDDRGDDDDDDGDDDDGDDDDGDDDDGDDDDGDDDDGDDDDGDDDD